VWLVAWGVRELRRALESANWPVVQGTVVSSAVASEIDRAVGSDISHPLPPVRMYKASIRYRYEVSGKVYEGQRIDFGPTFASSWATPAASAIVAYPAGKVVDVRVSPSEPSLSVLVPGAKWELYALLFVGAAFSAIGIGLLLRDRL